MGLFGGMFGTAKGCELAPKEAAPGLKLATFAGGCFWGLELAYQRVPGVVKTTVGYIGGHKANPTYDSVCSGTTGHTEAVQVTYKPEEVTFDQLLDVFFEKVDPTTPNRQGNDRGTQYRSGIFVHDAEQRAAAAAKVAQVNAVLATGKQYRAGRPYEGKQVVAELTDAGDYYLAEDYHQQYLEKGGRFNRPQSAAKGCADPIRCYG
eukprot:CAMPEP_0202858286 /NCGR_PEP_ID=MMETSP1391-20130828/884_1 /ASSEMBLY_ACC=CAM_ASM_000867 /TAXON_ID=1034604 /ORGANISM="Chlamydomonas leiostraca, Strain SAG 11-49" /LENGTH=205 /DNA_ID=CAMNT_0049537189 /DNA_START=166 /DNA_END=783 /DNA_ORIENTATION=-